MERLWVSISCNHLIIELIKHEREVQLEHEVEQLKYQVDKLTEEVKMLERKYGYESYLNNELIDLLRENHINFRPALARANRNG